MASEICWLPGLGKKQSKEKSEISWKEWKKKRKLQQKQWAEEKLLKKIRKNQLNEEKNNESSVESSGMETDKTSSARRQYSVSIALPVSVLNNAQSLELRTYLAGQIARAASIFNIDEIVIFDDEKNIPSSNENEQEFSGVKKRGQACSVMSRILQYLECPQYLRKYFFPLHPDLKFAGLLNPLDSPHHLRLDEQSPFREGCTLDIPIKQGKGSYVDVGLNKSVQVDKHLQSKVRVTVQMLNQTGKKFKGKIVNPEVPRTEHGLYWGYTVRIAKDFRAVFSKCPYNDGYDLIIGTSDKGSNVDDVDFPTFRHLLVAFGGLSGLEACFEDDETLGNPESLFTYYLNTCPNQGSRTIRTEEAILISMSILRPKIIAAGQKL